MAIDIVEMHPGHDAITREVTLLANDGVKKRPVGSAGTERGRVQLISLQPAIARI